jgi:hypothetical protein
MRVAQVAHAVKNATVAAGRHVLIVVIKTRAALPYALNANCSRGERTMAEDRFELSPDKPHWVRGFTLKGLVEFECCDDQTAEELLDFLNRTVADIVVSRYRSELALEWLPV